MDVFFLFGVEVVQNVSVLQKEGAVAELVEVIEIMGDHEGGDLMGFDVLFGEFHDKLAGFGIQGGGVFIEE